MTSGDNQYYKNDKDVCSFFTSISEDFDTRYNRDRDFRNRFDVWRALLDKYALPGGKAIDLGCGSGIYSYYLSTKGMIVTGIDGSEGMISLCNSRKEKTKTPNVTFKKAEIPFFNSSSILKSHLVISSSVLEYIDSLDDTIDLVTQLLVTNGYFIASIPNAKAIYRRMLNATFKYFKKPDYYRYVINQFTAEQFKDIVEKRGFRAEDFIFYGKSNPISMACRAIGVGPEFTSTLLVGVFRKIS
jgi:2-polyprenyl-6-hydroxyphenyl methylase/3-demethylubiquinone-9 3-methyltransferase